MKIISWNLRGLGARPKRALIKDLLVKENPDLVILQETKLNQIDRRVIKFVWSSRHVGWLHLEASNSAGGILIMWKNSSIEVSNSILGAFTISIECSFVGQSKGWITGVYGPCSAREKKFFLQELHDITGLCQGIWCIAGDFNLIRWMEDRQNGTRYTRNMKKFNKFIALYELIDIPMANGEYTRSRTGERGAASRLDRILISRQWADTFKEYRLKKLHRPTSDHFPIEL